MTSPTDVIRRAVGWVIYNGPSMIENTPIVAIVTPSSENTKTGPMAQAWILCRDVDPGAALKRAADYAICGTCVHRGPDRSCYVNVGWAPASVWASFSRGNYVWGWPPLDLPPIRLGAYGDPAAVPIEVWLRLLDRRPAWTGYTHLWKTCPPAFKRIVMASVDSPAERVEAERDGWRTYRVCPDIVEHDRNEIVCPASDEAGHKVTCLQCRLCMGTSKPAKSIVIAPHGRNAGSMYRRLQGLLPLGVD